MSGTYVGVLEREDPLYGYLRESVLPKMKVEVKHPVFRVSRLRGSNMVYRYHEERSELSLIGKFFGIGEPSRAARLMNEFRNLSQARRLGLTKLPNCVVRPLGRYRKLGLGLIEEFVEGRDLDHYICGAVYEGRRTRLMKRLTELAGFLAELHKRTMVPLALDPAQPENYFMKLVRKLLEKGLLDKGATARLMRLNERWRERDYMSEDSQVVIHGDATPTNFIFPKADGVVAIDLERMRAGDRMFDVGMVCGELKHAFLWRTGNKYAAEDYIGHFLFEYASHFGGGRAYRAVVLRNPFYMALTELRIARNGWLGRGHRAALVSEASLCLECGLNLPGF
ncbi:MAG TPA: aminoglycoside phosphotransferase family protein [Nitrospirota bacterium]